MTKDALILGVRAGRIAGVLEAEGGFFAGKRREGLLGVAQAMLDMTKSGRFGTGLDRVLRYHFAPPKERFSDECLDAVFRVFLEGERRDPSWVILAVRTAPFFLSAAREARGGYEYLGCDIVDPFRGNRYYGVRRNGGEKENEKEGKA